jgi:hypothetical protein
MRVRVRVRKRRVRIKRAAEMMSGEKRIFCCSVRAKFVRFWVAEVVSSGKRVLVMVSRERLIVGVQMEVVGLQIPFGC